MKLNLLITVISIASIFSSCGKKCPELRGSAAPRAPFKWIEGTWQMKTDSLEIVESWKTADEEMMKGTGFVVVRRDTVLHETLRLLRINENWVYIARIDGDPVLFTMRPGDNQKELMFENDEHEFPQRIRYINNGDSGITARIEGLEEGKPLTEEYVYRKIK